MSKETRDLEQLIRIDGRGCFLEAMLSGLGIDKMLLNFVEYDASASQGHRQKNMISFYMDVYVAKRLSLDILSGRIAKLGSGARKKAKEDNQRYVGPVFEQLGGTPARNTSNGVPIARQLTISPGASQPWVFCAKQGPGHETAEGLIVMDEIKTTIRVPMSNEKLKELGIALGTAFDLWANLRFMPVIAAMMKMAQDRRQEAIDAKKAASAERNDELGRG